MKLSNKYYVWLIYWKIFFRSFFLFFWCRDCYLTIFHRVTRPSQLDRCIYSLVFLFFPFLITLMVTMGKRLQWVFAFLDKNAIQQFFLTLKNTFSYIYIEKHLKRNDHKSLTFLIFYVQSYCLSTLVITLLNFILLLRFD